MKKNSSYNFAVRRNFLPVFLSFAVIALTIFALWYEGRIWWCKWDTPATFATLDAWSKHTSQHFFDPYSFTHLLHGFLFLWLLDLLVHKILRMKTSFVWLFFFAILIESVWEIAENLPAVIERYRENTASLDYYGDSIANSVGDIIACAFGFIVAYKLKFWRSFALFILIEVILILTIRDSLLINILMLAYPLDWIKDWQTNVS